MGFFRRKRKGPQGGKPAPAPPKPKVVPAKDNVGSTQEPRQLLVKLVLMGDGAVGKTSLRERFMGRGFRSSHLMTIGADFASTTLQVDRNSINLQIWDLAGQEMFESVRGRFYNGTMGGLLVFDITRRETFVNLPKWIQEAWKFSGRGPIPFVVLGNKFDLKSKAQVKISEARKFVDDLNQHTAQFGFENHFLETSALTGLNVQEAFHHLAEYVVKQIDSRES